MIVVAENDFSWPMISPSQDSKLIDRNLGALDGLGAIMRNPRVVERIERSMEAAETSAVANIVVAEISLGTSRG